MKKWWIFLVSGWVVAWGQPAWCLGLIAPLAAIGGLALFWSHAAQLESKSRFFLATAWFAMIQLVQLSWMTSIEYQGLYILIIYFCLALGMGLQFGVLTYFIDKVPLVTSAALWALMEWSRLHILCGLSFNPVGLALTSFVTSLQTVSIFGIFGLSFWVILTNLAFWRRRWKVAIGLALTPYVIGGIHWSFYQKKVDHSPTMNVALIQTALLPSQKRYDPARARDFVAPERQWERIVHLLAQIKEPVDLVVLPESAVPYSDDYPLYAKERVQEVLTRAFPLHKIGFNERLSQVSNRYWMHAISKILNADLIMGLNGQEGDHYYSSAFFVSKEAVHRYDKQVLLPLAEYLPFAPLKRWTAPYGINQFFTHGGKSTIFPSKVPVAASICYEETFGSILRQGRKEGAVLFVNLTNDNWYPHSKLPRQHFDLARAQAVASGTSLVRACNAGITSALDGLGQMVGHLDEWNVPGVLVVKVPLYQIFTLYTLWGDKGIVVLSIFLLIFTIIINRKTLFVLMDNKGRKRPLKE